VGAAPGSGDGRGDRDPGVVTDAEPAST